MSKEKECKCCHEYWYESEMTNGLCPNCYEYNKQLKQQLEEKDNLIEFGKEEIRKRNKRIDEIIERDKKLFDNKNKEIDEINKEFVQAVHDWKALCAEKDKEIEELKTKQELTFMHSKEDYFQRCNLLEKANIKLQFTQTQLAINELKKLRNNILINKKGDDGWTSLEVDLQYLVDTIDEQIEKLEGKKDAEN